LRGASSWGRATTSPSRSRSWRSRRAWARCSRPRPTPTRSVPPRSGTSPSRARSRWGCSPPISLRSGGTWGSTSTPRSSRRDTWAATSSRSCACPRTGW